MNSVISLQSRNYAGKFEIPYHIVKTDIAQILFEERKEKNPCSLCAKMRKGALNQAVKEIGCNKIAYAHHKDDIIETMILSLFFEGRFYSFSPKTYLDRMDLTVIRPIMFVDEADVIVFVVSGKEGITDADEYVTRILYKTHKPVILAVNKVDNPEMRNDIYDFYALGLGEPLPVSSVHGIGTGDVLDAIIENLPNETEEENPEYHQI